MFIDILEFRIEKNKKSLGKTVLKMWSQICGKKKFMCPQKRFKKKVQKLKKYQKQKIIKTFVICVGL